MTCQALRRASGAGYGLVVSMRHVALLRGINVGGRNLVSMSDLRAVFTGAGFDDVSTYIASGNVLFNAAPSDHLESDIETMLAERLDLAVVVAVRTAAQLQQVLQGAPAGFGTQPDAYYSDVVFCKAPLESGRVMEVIRPREGVDMAWSGDGVVYFQRLGERRSQSRLSTLASTPEYQLMTIRTWSTTTRLAELAS